MILGKGSRTIAPFPVSCYTVGEIRAASAMTRLEAHFFKRSQQERDKKTIRAANGILKPRKIRACKTRISEHEPRKGTETLACVKLALKLDVHFRTRTPKGDGNGAVNFKAELCVIFQNTNPERGRKP